jgi:hypothetical protein
MGFLYRIFPTANKIRRVAFFLLFYFLFLYTPRLFSAEVLTSITVQGTDTVYHLTHNDLKMGERLFYGLLREQQDQESCISCHNIRPVTTLSWNPSAADIAAASYPKSLTDLKGVLHQPVGKKMTQSHAGFNSLTDEQVLYLKGYLLSYYQGGGYQQRPIINNLLVFLALAVLFVLAFLDLVWFRVIRFRVVHVTVLLVTALFLARFTVTEALAIGRSKNYEPDQPIKFSHMVHAGQNQINCLYCHNSAEYGKSAGIPSASVCLNCHMIVREGSRSGRFEINKIFAAVEQKKPVQWIRVYNLPDHAFFSHAQHVGAGKLDCLTCHGPVDQMDRIVQVPDLSMGWCVNCHRETKVQFHDNQFYTKYEGLREQVERGEIDSVTVDRIGGTDCMKCHY